MVLSEVSWSRSPIFFSTVSHLINSTSRLSCSHAFAFGINVLQERRQSNSIRVYETQLSEMFDGSRYECYRNCVPTFFPRTIRPRTIRLFIVKKLVFHCLLDNNNNNNNNYYYYYYYYY